MNRIARTVVQLSFKNNVHRQIVAQTHSQAAADVPGLSKNTVDVPSGEVGFPRASKTATYKNPEYFSYTSVSYFEAEVELAKYRLPQPSNKKK